jgi:3-phosphoshikimate 1-carboxyvinyltransferase
MLDACETRLGVTGAQRRGGNAGASTGCGGVFPVKDADLFLGNAGTAFRPLTAALALSGGDYTLSGVPRMHERPIGDLVDACADRRRSTTPAIRLPAAASSGQVRAVAGPMRVRGDVSSQFLTAC